MADRKGRTLSQGAAKGRTAGARQRASRSSGKGGTVADVAQERICRFDPSGGHLVVRLTANNALHAGGEFGVWDPPAKELWEKWTMLAGVAGSFDYTIGTPPNQLIDAFLTWALVICSHDSSIDQGLVGIEVIQDGKACAIDPTAQYQRKVPACESGQALHIPDKLRFKGM